MYREHLNCKIPGQIIGPQAGFKIKHGKLSGKYSSQELLQQKCQYLHNSEMFKS